MEYGAKQNRAWRLWTDAVEPCLREIHLAPAIIDYQAVIPSYCASDGYLILGIGDRK